MLIYVNKKKERQKRIKKIILTVLGVMILLLNIFCFSSTLNKTSRTLTAYTPSRTEQEWYKNSAPITLFMTANPRRIRAVLLPEKLTFENAEILAVTFSGLAPSSTRLSFAKEISEKEQNRITQIARFLNPKMHVTQEESDIHFFKDLSAYTPTIHTLKLIPQSVSYQSVLNAEIKPETVTFLKTLFPEADKKEPDKDDVLALEEQNLKAFVQRYHTALKELTLTQKEPDFTAETYLLQNLKICLISQTQTVCELATDVSVKQNILTALSKLPEGETPQRLFLLSSFVAKARSKSYLKQKHTGVYCRFGVKEALLLPEETTANAYADCLTKLNINPENTNSEIKFYHFKTVEVPLDDKNL